MVTLTDNDIRQILLRRRDALGRYLAYAVVRYAIREMKVTDTVACSCCGYLTISNEAFDVCVLCWWCDDGQDDHNADVVRHGPNGRRSLTAARASFRQRLSSLPPGKDPDPDEHQLDPQKRAIMEIFDDKMAGALSSAQFIEHFRAVRVLIDELIERRQALRQR